MRKPLPMEQISRLAHHFVRFNADTTGHAEKRLGIFVALQKHPWTHVHFFEAIHEDPQAVKKYMALLQDIDRISG